MTGWADALLWWLGAVWALSAVTYALPQLLQARWRRPQNLKTKYGAEWAIVTGGSSGIGRALVERLAAQGLNVIIAAYPDQVFNKAMTELKSLFPAVEILPVPVDLSKPDFMKTIVDAVGARHVQIIVNNAGYIKTGFFTGGPDSPAGQLSNFDVNLRAPIELTRHFVRKLQAAPPALRRGCVTFTSSPAGLMPCPTSAMYGVSKAALTMFGQSLAPEVYGDGIEVTVLHPSPVTGDSRFYDKAFASGPLEFMRGTGTTPAVVADALLAGIGRTSVVEQGYYPWCVRLLLRIIDVNFLADIITMSTHRTGDYIKLRALEAEATTAAASGPKSANH